MLETTDTGPVSALDAIPTETLARAMIRRRAISALTAIPEVPIAVVVSSRPLPTEPMPKPRRAGTGTGRSRRTVVRSLRGQS